MDRGDMHAPPGLAVVEHWSGGEPKGSRTGPETIPRRSAGTFGVVDASDRLGRKEAAMVALSRVARSEYAGMDDAELVLRARAGEREAFRQIMQRGNQRLFRIARGVVRDDAEAEDVLQE